MAGRLGRRVVHFANLPIKLLMPSTFDNITEISLKTIPSASKIEIKRVLESLYGFQVEKVQTLNMEGKKKQRGGILLAKPDYKKAFVTLKYPLSISPNLFPIKLIEDDKKELNKQSKTSIVESEGGNRSHWLQGNGNRPDKTATPRYRRGVGGSTPPRPRRTPGRPEETAKFPWTSMRKTNAVARFLEAAFSM